MHMVAKQFVLSLAALTVTSCISTISMEGLAGVTAGSKMATSTAAILYECDPFVSNSEAWFGSEEPKTCIKSGLDKTRYDEVISDIPVGTFVQLNRARKINGVDTVVSFIEASVIIDGITIDCFIYGFDLNNLLALENE